MARKMIARDPRGRGAPYEFEPVEAGFVASSSRDLRSGQKNWAARGAEYRLSVLKQWADRMRALGPELRAALEADTGRRLLSAQEVEASLRRIDYWRARAPGLLARESRGQSESAPGVGYRHASVPYGLVGVISPWNFPLLLTLTDAIPALAAGCAVLAKPSETTPRFAAPLQESIDAVPALADVFRVVIGDGVAGEAVVDHADAVCFTGSVETGRRVGARAGERLVPAFLELGGKDPLIVLEGADPDLAAATALRSSCVATGQACQSIERIYVHESLHDDFVRRLVEAARQVALNTESIDAGDLGPFIDPAQAEKVERQIGDALRKGAVRHTGEFVRRGEAGVWLSPVVLTGVDHDMSVMTEETFGPVMPVMPFAIDEQAIALANDSRFGLSAAVLGDEERALAVAREIDAGAVSINDAGLTTMVSDVEKDSFGQSGLGRSRMGASGLTRFLRSKALLVQHGPPLPLAAFAERPDGE